MDYKFPIIRNIQDVVPFIEGRSEFIVAHKEGYTVINYMVDTGHTFRKDEGDEYGYTVRRECRGVKFDSVSGEIIARPFHKFANVNQWVETQTENIEKDKISHYTLKLDGSMIHPAMIKGKLEFCTKMGITDTSKLMLSEIDNIENIIRYCQYMVDNKKTPIFEYCSPNAKIVIQYKKPELILTAVRDMITGQYLDIHSHKEDIEKIEGIRVVDSYSFDFDKFEDFFEMSRLVMDKEGYIGHMKNGHMFKAKGDEYVMLHKNKEQILNDRFVIEKMLNNEIDDIIAKLDKEDRDKIEKIISDFVSLTKTKKEKLNAFCHKICSVAENDPKVIGVVFVPKILDKSISSFLFEYAKHKNIDVIFDKRIRNSLSQNVRYTELIEWFNKEVM